VPNRPPPTISSTPVITSIVTDRLCGSMPITTCDLDATWSSLPDIAAPFLETNQLDVEPRGHRYFEPSKPLLSLSRSVGTPDRAGQS